MPIVIKTAGFQDLLTSGDYYLKALVIGEHGSGKTPFAAQWPKPLFAMCENGHLSLAQTGTPYADINTSADMQALLDHCRIESRKPITSRSVQTLVIDTIDSYQRRLIRERLKAEGNKEGLSGWADWGWLDGKMIHLIEQINALAMNVVVLMHTKDIEETSDAGSTVTQRARMKGDIKESVFQDFPLIGLMETYYAAEAEGGKAQRVLKRRLRWHPDPKHPVLRDQSTKLPQFTAVDFSGEDYSRIYGAITEGLDDLPEVKVLETLETEADVQDVPEDAMEGGPVEKPALPKAAAKKAPAKKAAAKKAAAKPPAAKAEEPETPGEEAAPAGPDTPAVPASSPEPSDPWTPPAEAPAEEPKQEELPRDADPGEKAPEPTRPGAKVCGAQPVTFAGKQDPHPGCGRVIGDEGVVNAPAAIVKFRTYLCTDCFSAAVA